MNGSGLSRDAEAIFRVVCEHAFDEAVSWPSQARIARLVRRSREHVNRVIHRELIPAGAIEIVEKRNVDSFGQRVRWRFNVYSILAPFSISSTSAEYIVKAARRRAYALYLARLNVSKLTVRSRLRMRINPLPVIDPDWRELLGGGWRLVT